MCKFCEGQVDFSIVKGDSDLSGFVKIPREEYALSDDDFDIYFDTFDGVIEDCDFHGDIDDTITGFIGDSIFLELVCDHAHEDLFEGEIVYDGCVLNISISGDDFYWD